MSVFGLDIGDSAIKGARLDLKTRAKIVPAQMLNTVGITGAALAPESVPKVVTPG